MLAAIETTGETCGVAIFEGSVLRAELHIEMPRAHDRLLASMYREALSIVGASPDEIEALAVSVGPGSFTGIRIGLSFVSGLSMATGAEIIPVPTLDAISFNQRELGLVGKRSRVISLIPAGALGLYATLYEIQPEFRRLTETRTIAAADVLTLLDENVFAAGPGAKLLDQSFRASIAVDSETLTARCVGRRALELRKSGVSVTPEELEPLYISGLAFANPAGATT